ncbi:MAG: ABC transporter ATP-binding protein [Clostridiales bacterium]|nr:ABC transporter ATP-binding protein [Clostridiales bacterium]
MLNVTDVSVRFGKNEVVSKLSFSVEEGQWLMLCGPNGAGKSTLVNAIAQTIPYSGKISWKNENLSRMSSREIARRIGVLSQHNSTGYDFRVEEVVALGRYVHTKGILNRNNDDTAARVENALGLCDLKDFAKRSILTLSGGELQRVFLAQVFAQDPALLILDEPANHLDMPYQKQLFELIAAWVAQPGKAVISVVHDLSLAKRYGSHALLMNHGKNFGFGPVSDVLTGENLNSVYGMDIQKWMQEMYRQWK